MTDSEMIRYLKRVFDENIESNQEMFIFSAGILALVGAIDRVTDKLELIENELHLVRGRL